MEDYLPSSLFYLDKKDVEDLLNLHAIIRVVEESYVASSLGKSTLCTPRSFAIHLPKTNLPWMLIKGAAIHGVFGCRIIVYPADEQDDGTRFILLSDAVTGNPIGLVNEIPFYALRVGAQVAVAAQYLAVAPVRRVGIIGTGKIAEGVLKMIATLFPLEKVYVTSRSQESRVVFSERLSLSLGLIPEPVATSAECCRETDLVVTATTANAPILRREDLSPRTLVVSLGAGQELAPEIVLKADKVLVDDWEYCTSMGELVPLVADNRFRRENLYGEIGEIVAGLKPGRERETERIVAIPQGLTSADVAVAAWIMDQARKKESGTKLSL